ncbi:MAG: magnesium transporter CorA family protein [Patescibacteria group bacterium]
MIKQLRYKNITWIDATAPSVEEIEKLADQYKIHPFITGDLKTPSPRSKINLYKETIHLVCHFPAIDFFYNREPNNKPSSDHSLTEMVFIISQDFVISLHQEPSPPLEELSKIFESGFNDLGENPNGSHLLYYLLRHLYLSLGNGLDLLGNELKKTSHQVFAGREKEMVLALANLNQHLMNFRWALKNHEELLHSLNSTGSQLFGEDFHYYGQNLISEYNRVWYMLENYRETFQDVQNTNNSLLSIKNNETVKILTVLAFIFLPISLVANFFSFTVSTPLEKSPYGLVIILIIAIITLITTLSIAKYKKWL